MLTPRFEYNNNNPKEFSNSFRIITRPFNLLV